MEENKRKEGKIPHMCKSVGHQPLPCSLNYNHNLLKRGTLLRILSLVGILRCLIET